MIRPINKADKKVFLEMVYRFYHSPAVLHTIPQVYAENTFDELMSENPFAICYIIEHNNEVAGYVLLAMTYSNEVGSRVLWIDELWIEEKFRSCGLGGQVFDFLHEEYKDCGRLRLEVAAENHGAIRLYTRRGYRPLDYLQMIYED